MAPGDPRTPRPIRLALFGLLALVAGCGGPPQISPANRRLVESLATAVSARSPDWLAENVAIIESKRREGTIPDHEYATFRSVIAAAEAGRWDEAEREAFALRDVQRGTAEDAAKVEARQVDAHDRPLAPLKVRAPSRHRPSAPRT